MKILGIDTSCDDTCVAVLKIENCKLKILSNVVSSQVKLHAKYGGVYPTLAKREHQKNLPIVFKKALRQAQGKYIKQDQIDLIAVTIGPGLEPCLWQGVNFAKDLSNKLKIPVIPVNHIEAHILANFIDRGSISIISFPAICLVVSGGHTGLILMKGIGKYRLIGETRDDAAGECFDKVARILGLGYPGGPAIAAEATKLKAQSSKFKVSLPRPMIYQKNYDFSFSGLKTAVLYDFRNRSQKVRKSKKYIREMAAEVQQAVIDVLIKKTLKAAKDYRVRSIILGGGVAANTELRKQFLSRVKSQESRVKFFVPLKNFCTDNAVMVGVVANFHWLKGEKRSWQEITVDANLKI
jgi:N6-L-threonylcarbamoyladenine synthase